MIHRSKLFPHSKLGLTLITELQGFSASPLSIPLNNFGIAIRFVASHNTETLNTVIFEEGRQRVDQSQILCFAWALSWASFSRCCIRMGCILATFSIAARLHFGHQIVGIHLDTKSIDQIWFDLVEQSEYLKCCTVRYGRCLPTTSLRFQLHGQLILCKNRIRTRNISKT